MKYYVFVVASLVQSTLSARPAVVSNETGILFCGECDTMPYTCANSGLPTAYTYTHSCGFTCCHDKCKIKGCARYAEISDGMIKCIPAGKSFEAVPGKPAEYSGSYNCCNFDARTSESAIDEKGNCACASVGTRMATFGAGPTDCCSGTWNEKKKECVKRVCKKKGESAPDDTSCCAHGKVTAHDDVVTVTSQYSRTDDGKCSCFPAGAIPSTEDDVSGSNCCSGTLESGGTACKCIDDKKPLEPGAVASDCCSGKTSADGKTCLSSKCLEVGLKLGKGDHCCSKSPSGQEGVCKCLPPGSSLPEGASKRACCSGRLDSPGGKCDHLKVGETPNMKLTDSSVCLSGEIDSSGKCSCIHDGKKSKNAKQCCSEKLDADGKCACISTGQALKNGAVEGDCCSRFEDRLKGVCRCGPPGAPSRKGNKGRECCSNSTKGGFCGCFGPSTQIAVGDDTSSMCCGGLTNTTSNRCQCIRDGMAVASYVHDGACCNNGVNLGGVCREGKKEAAPERKGR